MIAALLPMKSRLLILAVGALWTVPSAIAQIEESAAIAGYLFAHMTSSDYGRLYYSISQDGLHWSALHGGQRILNDDYLGHPEICRGPDDRYWLVGVGPRGTPSRLILWESVDLVTWKPGPEVAAEHFNVGERRAGSPYLGAPKLFFDDHSQQFYLTWHAARTDLPAREIHGVNEARWSDMRTFVSTSYDLKTWSEPRRLFPYDLATIDVILRREGGRYYAILKDERYPTAEWPTGKSIRIASAPTPDGPWSEPGPKISPNYHEAPTVLPQPDGQGWWLYHEQYPGAQYGLSVAPSLAGPWYNAWVRTYKVVPEARHGCMIPLTAREFARLIAAFGPIEPTPTRD